ncbi:MAG: class I SAM-dependent methyltransferase [Cyanobacteria bacterium J06642_3]
MTVESRYTKYDTWAWLYNLTMGSTYAESQFQTLSKILLPTLNSCSSILDLCCGTGQLAVLLSGKGYQVTGLDSSEQMLKYAQQNSRHQSPQTNFILSDARDFSLDNPVDAVISTSASLNHIMSLSELNNVFVRVNNALTDRGVFFFDINHHGQLDKWWNGLLAEGEISDNYAWGIMPNYDSDTRIGSFQVLLYEAAERRNNNLFQIGKNLSYKLLSLKIFNRFRLRVLHKFHAWQPDWNYAELDYPVRGHTVEEIQQALAKTGFSQISVLTLDGEELDNNHSAYFMAYKS